MIQTEGQILDATEDIIVPTDRLAPVQELYDQGQMYQSYLAAESIGPLRLWRGAAARVLAGRLAMNLGSQRLGTILHIFGYRENPNDDVSKYYFARATMDRRGPLVARKWMEEHPLSDDADAFTRADWLSQLAMIAVSFRDFDEAESLIDQAQKLAPRRAWLFVERAHLLESEDRYEEAYEVARRSIELVPWFRPGIQSIAHILQILDRDEEALALLTEAAEKIESGPVVWQLASLQDQMERSLEARQTLDHLENLLPLMDKFYARSLAALKSTISYHCGDIPAAIQFAADSKNEFLKKVCARMENLPEDGGKRVLLDVPFVRQHHLTCAPATLSAISRFWVMPADQLTLAEAICYDGTPAYSERNWAEKNGWLAREFTVTADSTVALINRGIPFTLTTSETTSAHLQAVIGYDSRRGTLLVRDPFRYYHGEFHTELGLKRYASTGPRGMVMVPLIKAYLLDDIDFPDGDLYDQLYLMHDALQRHDRPAAADVLAQMKTLAPAHRLTHTARRSLASYDSDLVSQFAAVEDLLALYPQDGHLRLAKISLLSGLGRHAEQRQLLEEICQDGKCEPVFQLRLASELRGDARNSARAMSLMQKALRRTPTDGQGLHGFANLLWAKNQRAQALRYYRAAACVNDKQEFPAESYFRASRFLRKTDEALTFLSNRFRRYGKRSNQPVRTLFNAYETLERTNEAMEILVQGRKLRPDDGELILFAADVHARFGELDKARELLESAKGRTHRIEWLRRAAQIAQLGNDRAQSLNLWRQVIDGEPLAMDGHSAVARLIAETESPAAALAHLNAACERFPHYLPLSRLRVEWLHEQGAQAQEPAIRALLENHPSDSWARRELSLALCAMNRLDEALIEAQAALEADPNTPPSHYVQARVLMRLNRVEKAREAYQNAIRISVDYQPAISELVESYSTQSERRSALKFIYDQLACQTILGDAVLSYRTAAADTLDGEELLKILREALQARPDLWQAHSAVVRQLLDTNHPDQAHDLAKKALEKFPLMPRLWLDMAFVCRGRRDNAGEINAIEESLRLSPSWSLAGRMLSDALIRNGDLAKAIEAMNRTITRDPLDAQNHATLAETLWHDGAREQAIERARQAVLLEPGLSRTWEALRSWTERLGQKDQVVQMARELTQRRGGEARSWLVLAETLRGEKNLDERISACDSASRLYPRSIPAADLKAQILTEARRFDDAELACKPEAFGGDIPLPLRGRLAWIAAQRGDSVSAIAQMTALLAEDHSYYWGWLNLCNWLQDGNDDSSTLAAAADFARHFPGDPSSLLGLAGAHLRVKDRAAARISLANLLDIYPDHTEALYRLFDLQLEDRDFPAAETTLKGIQKHHPGDWAIERQIALCCRQKNAPEAGALLRKLAPGFTDNPRPLNDALKCLDVGHMMDLADKIIGELAIAQDATPEMAELWMKRIVHRQSYPLAVKAMKQLGPGSENWLAAAPAFVEAFATLPKMRWFILTNRKSLRQSDGAWGIVGFAYLTSKRYRSAIKWLSDYRQRQNILPWMILNLTLSLARVGKTRRAREASEYALTLPRDGTTARHLLRIAIDDALQGIVGEPAHKFAECKVSALPENDQFLATILNSMREVIEAPADQKREAYRNARMSFHTACGKFPYRNRPPATRKIVRKARIRMAHEGGNWASVIGAHLLAVYF